MPKWISEAWLKEYGGDRRELGEVPRSFVWRSDAGHFPEFDLATPRGIEGKPWRFELEWFS